MALLTFPWDDVGMANEMEVTEYCHTLRHSYSGGYAATAPDGTRIQKLFSITWLFMTPAQWLALVEFWRSVGGSSNAFYIEFPVELYGSPGYGGYGSIEPDDGFDADLDTGFGGGPAFTVRFNEDSMSQKYTKGFQRWSVQVSFMEVA